MMTKTRLLIFPTTILFCWFQFACSGGGVTNIEMEPTTTLTDPKVRDVSAGKDFIFVVDEGRLIRISSTRTADSEVLVSSGEVQQVFFLDENVGWMVGARHQVLATEDGGRSWQQRGMVDANEPAIAGTGRIQFINRKVGWYSNMSGIWKTVDGGDGWNLVYPNDSFSYSNLNAQPLNLSVVSENVAWLSMTNGKILLTVNGGSSWEQAETPFQSDVTSIFCQTDKSCWASVRANGLYHSNDGGKVWKQALNEMFQKIVTIHSVTFPNTKIGWAIGYASTSVGEKLSGVALKTADGGVTWTRLEGVPYDSSFSFISFADEKNGWLVGGGVFDNNSVIYHTPDGGNTWRKVADL